MIWILSTIKFLGPESSSAQDKELAGIWVTHNLTSMEIESEFIPDYQFDKKYGKTMHFYGVWSNLEEVPYVYIHLGSGEIEPGKNVSLSIRGKGKYRIRLFYQRNSQLMLKEKVVEATNQWQEITFSTDRGLSILGGLMERPGIRLPFKLQIVPYYSKEDEEINWIFDLQVSPVFVK